MGLRAFTTPYSYDGNERYRVELIDTDFTGTAVELMNQNSLTITMDGSPKNRFKVLNGTSVEVPVVIDHREANQMAVFKDLAQQQEGRFFLKVLKYDKNPGAGGFEPIFIGHLTMDETFLDNGPFPTLTWSADDGLNRLKEQEFVPSEPISNAYGDDVLYYEGEETIHNIIMMCLEGVGTQDQYSLNYSFLRVNVQWFESSMADILNPALERIRINHRIFTRRDSEGNYYTTKRSEVLEYCLNWCNAKMSYQWGNYYIENLNELGLSSRTFTNYRKNGDFYGRTAESLWNTNVEASGVQVLSGGKCGYLPPLKEACVTMSFDVENYGYSPTAWGSDEDTLVSLGQLQINADTSIFGTFIVEFDYKDSTAGSADGPRQIIFWFGVTVKITLNGQDFYYVTEEESETVTIAGEDQAGDPYTHERTFYTYTDKWSTTEGVLLFKTQRSYFGEEGVSHLDNWEFVTAPIISINDDPDITLAEPIEEEDIGEMFVKIEFVRGTFRDDPETDLFDLAVPANAGSEFNWQIYQSYFTPYEAGKRLLADSLGIRTCATFEEKNSVTIDVKTRIGDAGFNSNNRTTIFDGTEWVPSAQGWAVGSTSGTDKSQDLLLKEIVAGQPSTLNRYQGTFKQVTDPRHTLNYGGVDYVPHTYKHDIIAKTLAGEFLEFKVLPKAIEINENAVQATNTGTLSTSTGSSEGGGTGVRTERAPFEFEGPLTELLFDSLSLILPDQDVVGPLGVDVLLQMKRNGVYMAHLAKGSLGYTIDVGLNKVVLNRALRADDYIRGYLIRNIE